jgi:UDP-sugar transporter A1/2/3
VLSGFAGVYFEKILKGSQTTLWVRNIQMGIPSIILALVGVMTSAVNIKKTFIVFALIIVKCKDSEIVRSKGFFYGYNTVVVVVIVLQAVGGLVVAVVVKYADNILKGFAASFSLITAIALSYMLFKDFIPSSLFIIGAVSKLSQIATICFQTSFIY